MSSLPMEIASPGDCCAFRPLDQANRIPLIAISEYKTLLVMMFTFRGAVTATLLAKSELGICFSLRNEAK